MGLPHHTQFPRKPNLTDQHSICPNGCIAVGRGDRGSHRQVGGRLLNPQSADHIGDHVLVAEVDAQPACEHCCKNEQAVEVDTVGRAAWVAKVSGGGEALDFHQERTGAFHGHSNRRAWGVDHTLRQEDLAGVAHFHHAFFLHFKHANFAGRAKAVLDRA